MIDKEAAALDALNDAKSCFAEALMDHVRRCATAQGSAILQATSLIKHTTIVMHRAIALSKAWDALHEIRMKKL